MDAPEPAQSTEETKAAGLAEAAQKNQEHLDETKKALAAADGNLAKVKRAPASEPGRQARIDAAEAEVQMAKKNVKTWEKISSDLYAQAADLLESAGEAREQEVASVKEDPALKEPTEVALEAKAHLYRLAATDFSLAASYLLLSGVPHTVSLANPKQVSATVSSLRQRAERDYGMAGANYEGAARINEKGDEPNEAAAVYKVAALCFERAGSAYLQKALDAAAKADKLKPK